MINVYEYLFYKLYQWSRKVNGESFFYHKAHACMMMAVVLALNILTLSIIINLITGIKIKLPELSKLGWASIALVYIGLNYVYFSYGGRYLKVLSQYRNEDVGSARIGNIMITIYVIGSFTLLIVCGFLGVYIKSRSHP